MFISKIPKYRYNIHRLVNTTAPQFQRCLSISILNNKYYSTSSTNNDNNSNNVVSIKEIKNGIIHHRYHLHTKDNMLVKDMNHSDGQQIQNQEEQEQHDSIIKKSIYYFQRLFLPSGYPRTVSSDYINYQKWLFFQNTLGSTTYVLSTHALLSSVWGMSVATSLPFAAAISWVLKDGLGASALVLFASKYSTLFDYDIKKYKFRGDLLHNTGVLMEMCTPFVPGYFLPMASVSNLCKGLAGLVYGSTRASLNRSFSLKENIGDITAKYQSQSMAAYLSGMAIGSSVGMVLSLYPMSTVSSLGMVFGLSLVHVLCGYKSLKSIKLKTLNEQRTCLLMDHFIQNGCTIDSVLSVDIVNDQEKFIQSSDYQAFSSRVKLGASVGESLLTCADLASVATQKHKYLIKQSTTDNTLYVVFLDDGRKEEPVSSTSPISISNYTILKSYFHCFVLNNNNNASMPRNDIDQFVDTHFPIFMQGLSKQGWAHEPNQVLMFAVSDIKLAIN